MHAQGRIPVHISYHRIPLSRWTPCRLYTDRKKAKHQEHQQKQKQNTYTKRQQSNTKLHYTIWDKIKLDCIGMMGFGSVLRCDGNLRLLFQPVQILL